jgi:hypothetical protein
VSRIFTSLVILALSFLVFNIVLGLRTGDYNGEFDRVQKPLEEFAAQLRVLGQGSKRDRVAIAKVREQRRELLAEIAPMQGRASTHILFGIVTALVNMLVCSISITYFVGSSRWLKEVTLAYEFDTNLLEESIRLKRQTFACALSAMLIIVGISALGAAANPGTLAEFTENWVTTHFLSALVGTGLIAASYFVQLGNIRQNYQLIGQMTRRVGDVRRERGLEE